MNPLPITVGIKSFLRTPQLRETLKALQLHPWTRIIIADDGPIDAEKQALYATMQKVLPITLLELPFDTGLSAGRNAIVDHCDTPYLLMLDDDQIVPPNIVTLLQAIESDPKLGGVSCRWEEYGKFKCIATNLRLYDQFILKDIQSGPRKITRHDPFSLLYFDQIPNSTLFRMECLKDQKWDPYFKIGREHLDFYLTHFKLNQWCFAVVPEVIITHRPTRDPLYQKKYRDNHERLERSRNYFWNKWHLHLIEGLKWEHPGPAIQERLIHCLAKLRISPSLLYKLSQKRS